MNSTEMPTRHGMGANGTAALPIHDAGPIAAGLPLYDVHAHLADQRLDTVLEPLLQTAFHHGVRGILVNAARLREWQTVIRLSQNPCLHGALGIHPFFLEDWNDQTAHLLDEALGAHPAIRAVGEIGLDCYHGRDNLDRQIEAFAAQVQCAVQRHLPVIVHNRRSWNEFFAVIKGFSAAELQGVCHHFTGSVQVARQALDAGFYLSFCGPLTYPNARRIQVAARYAPLDRLLTETDTPDLPVAALRGQQSRPQHVRWILAELARLKQVPVATVAQAVEENYRRLLGLPQA